MYHVYILQSNRTGKFYIGSTNDPEGRLQRHNHGKNRYTAHGLPWNLIYSESFTTRPEAYKREMQIKRYKGGEAFRKLINKYIGEVPERSNGRPC